MWSHIGETKLWWNNLKKRRIFQVMQAFPARLGSFPVELNILGGGRYYLKPGYGSVYTRTGWVWLRLKYFPNFKKTIK